MKYVGEIFKTNNYGDLIITKYVDYSNVHVKFIDTGYETVARIDHIKEGKVKDKLLPTVYGVGSLGDEISKIKGKHTKEYKIWLSMLTRCYDTKYHKSQPTYANCTTSEHFKHYPYFKNWCSKQVGFNNDGWQLDKDILVKGNKVYSEDVCVFVPREINNLLTTCAKSRGESYIGVCLSTAHDKFVAKLRNNGTLIHLGYFDTEIEAFEVYKKAKEAYIKEVANKWKDQIDLRVYNALMKYQVEITD